MTLLTRLSASSCRFSSLPSIASRQSSPRQRRPQERPLLRSWRSSSGRLKCCEGFRTIGGDDGAGDRFSTIRKHSSALRIFQQNSADSTVERAPDCSSGERRALGMVGSGPDFPGLSRTRFLASLIRSSLSGESASAESIHAMREVLV
ncbi:hypothetical protein AB1Y20_004764 [Prymnesium parvum]|uniref:Uncharacterized protein n=1 Tax=Prymnesium parvum TaxID=97485 RepID=A0AB34J046_PRYPA